MTKIKVTKKKIKARYKKIKIVKIKIEDSYKKLRFSRKN